jgi:hypothetical protein
MESPRKYSLKELGDVKIELGDVHFGKNWREDPENSIVARYKPKDPLKAKCSFCRTIKDVYSIEGVSYTKGGETPKSRIFHQSFLLICKGCCTAREILGK